ncbi:hypothetical protein [Mucilaginibacter panaciglaebae]|uniref:Quercetin dioxygenase-like cupin family protein n=1 Tax=Mucilaginibacter panaciglaebae TaxID=502331 RepID=A0ABP7WTQ9_9SPHI
MIIPEILSLLETAETPVIKILQQQASGKVLALGFKKGMILKEHQTAVPAKLVVIEGTVLYRQGEKSITLNKLSDLDIPVKITHWVEALQDSICLLILG